MGFMSRREAPLQGFGYGDVVHQQDLGRQTVDIYVLKTMIYCINQVSLRKSWSIWKALSDRKKWVQRNDDRDYVEGQIELGLTQANSANPAYRRYLCVKNNDLLYKPGFFT